MTRPTRYLIQMVIFLTIIIALSITLRSMLLHAFCANPGLNGLILAILLLGVLWNARLVIRLWPEVHWIELLRIPRTGLTIPPPPNLLAPISGLLATHQQRGNTSLLSSQTTNMLLDSLGARMDEGREISRYITQLLIFLGLLGTFYGLLLTVRSIADVIGSMSSTGADPSSMFDHVKLGLINPLNGMATAFSGSMFGLAGSLILGFLDLTASQAQNRFFNDLEEWLLTVTQLQNTQPPQADFPHTQHDQETEALEPAATAMTQYMETWMAQMHNFISITTDNLSILQRSMGILHDIVIESNTGRQNVFTLLQQMSSTLEEMKNTAPQGDETTTTPILQQIERQLAGLRDDLRHHQDAQNPSHKED